MFRKVVLALVFLALLAGGYYFVDSLTPGEGEITGFSVKESESGSLITGQTISKEEETVEQAKIGNQEHQEAIVQKPTEPAAASAEFDVSLTITG